METLDAIKGGVCLFTFHRPPMSTEQLYTIILLNASETRSLAYTNNRYHELDRMGRIANVNLRGVRTEVALKRAIDTAFGEVHQKEIMTNTNGLLRPVESEGGAFIRVIPSNFFTLRVTTRSTPYRFYVRYKANCPLNCTCEPQTPNTPQSPLLGRGSSVASSSPLPTGVFEVNDHSFSLARLLFNRSRGRQDDDDSFFSPDREPTELEKRNEAMKRLNIQVSLWTQSQSRRPFNNPPFKMNSITEDVVPMMLKYFSKSSLNLTSRLDVTGLEGIDGGGVSRHVFTVFFESLKTFKLNGKLPLLEEVGTTGLYILSVLEDSLPYAYEYVPFALGRILAYAIIHRLPLPMYLHVDFFLSLVQATAYMDSNTLIDMPQTAHVNSAFMDTSAPYLVQKYITCETVQDIQMLLEEYEAIKDIQLVQEEEEQTLEGLKDLFVVYDVIGQRRRFVDPFLKGLNPDNLMVVSNMLCSITIEAVSTCQGISGNALDSLAIER